MIVPIDLLVKGGECNCEFSPYQEGDEDEGEESWHYLRKCLRCGYEWYGLHCPHDRFQNRCPSCKYEPIPIKEGKDER